jgi:transposase-like protein
MTQTFNVYCDESCHLENDHQPIMVLGAVWCPLEKTREISGHIREIKKRHNLKPEFEIKWIKVSPGKMQFYLELIDYFFDNEDLHFRGLIVPDKSQLQHEIYTQTHDDWYYKMYFTLLKAIFDPQAHYKIYLDIKDTQGSKKVAKLHDVLSNNLFDFSRQIIEKLQTVRSHEVEILQLADLLIGTISYINRGLSSNTAKCALVERMRDRSGYSLTKTTLYLENKVNLLCWQASEALT